MNKIKLFRIFYVFLFLFFLFNENFSVREHQMRKMMFFKQLKMYIFLLMNLFFVWKNIFNFRIFVEKQFDGGKMLFFSCFVGQRGFHMIEFALFDIQCMVEWTTI